MHTFPSHWGVTSGRCRAIDIHPQDPNIVYIGAASGGIWKTVNGGDSWQTVSDNFNTISFGAIALDPNNPEVVYAGTGEAIAGVTPNIYYGDGLYKTTNGGLDWNKIGIQLNAKTHFSDIVVSPVNPNLVFASLAIGNMYLQTPEKSGVWRSSDGGQTWQNTLVTTEAYDIEGHPTNENIMYAAAGGANSSAGFYISNDKGQTWTKSLSGLPAATSIYRMQITLCKGTPQIMYAYAFCTSPNGGASRVFRSSNGGINWTEIVGNNPLGGYHTSAWWDQGNYDLCIAVKPDDPGFVLAGNIEMHRATIGTDFSVIRNPGYTDIWGTPVHCDYHKIAFSQANPQIVYIVNDGGIYKSVDGGMSWNNKNNFISTIQFYAIASHPTDRNRLVGGAQDNGNFTTVDKGSTNWQQTTTGDGMNCFYDYINPNIVYFSVQNGFLFKSTNGAAGYNSGIPISPGYAANEYPAWTAPFFIHPTNHIIIYVASNRLWKSVNAGSNWFPVSSSFPVAISSMDQCRLYPEVMILAEGGNYSSNTPVHVSTDEGVTWHNITSGIPGPARYIANVKIDPLNKNVVYLVRSGFGSGKIYQSLDFGLHWMNISGDLPDIPHNDLFIDPIVPGHLYTANDFGVYHSLDGGSHWSRLSSGIPVVPVIDFDYVVYGSTRLLRAATHGRSAYELELPAPTASYITLINPQGAQKFVEGSGVPVRWIKNNVSSVNIYLSNDNKISWQTVVNNFPADSMQYNWQVPIGIADSCFIKIEDALNSSVYQINHLSFSILHLRAPLVVRPINGTMGCDNEPVLFEWKETLGANRFAIEIAVDSLFAAVVHSDTAMEQTKKEIVGLHYNTKYFWHVAARNNLIQYQYSNTYNFTTQLAKPVLFSPANNSTNIASTAGIQWNNVDGAQKYHLQISKSFLFAQFVVNDSNLFTNNYTAASLENSKNYYWRVRAGNQYGFGKYAAYFKFQTGTSAVAEELNGLPDDFKLLNNYPNPFNPETAILFTVPLTEKPVKVLIRVFDVMGKELAVLLNEEKEAGYHTVPWNARGLASGVYLCRMEAMGKRFIIKMLFTK